MQIDVGFEGYQVTKGSCTWTTSEHSFKKKIVPYDKASTEPKYESDELGLTP